MSKKVNFNTDRKDTWGGLIPSDSEVLYVLEIEQKPMTVKNIRDAIEKTRDTSIRTTHISNTLNRLHRAEKVNKHIQEGKDNEWRVGWGIVVNLSAEDMPENFSFKPVRKKRKIINNDKIMDHKESTFAQSVASTKYATDEDRVKFAKSIGYKTIDEAIKDIGSWDFEKKLKAYSKFNKI